MEESFICSSCIQEDYLASYIQENGTENKCSFCDEYDKAIEIDTIVEIIQDGIEFIYDDPANGLGWVDGEWVEGTDSVKDTYDLLVDEFGMGASPALNVLLAKLPDHSWCKKDFYGPDEAEEKYFTWDYFVRQVKYNTRFFFMKDNSIMHEHFRYKKPYEILEELFLTFEKLELFSSLDKGTIIYRARSENRPGQYSTAEELGAPKPEQCIYSNRMSPSGISMFYGSEDQETCLIEAKEKKGLYAIGKWQTQKTMKLLNLTKNFVFRSGNYYYPEFPSIFDTTGRDTYHDYSFILRFAKDLSKKVAKDGMENIDYVPTQVITEYLRVIKRKTRIMGICFYSSINGHKNYCLFLNDKDCKDNTKIKLCSVSEQRKSNITCRWS